MLKTVVTLLALALCGADLFVLRAQADLVDTGCGSTCTDDADCTYESCGGTIGLEQKEKDKVPGGEIPMYNFACKNGSDSVDKGDVGRCQYRYYLEDSPWTTCPISVKNADCAGTILEADGSAVEPSTSDGAFHYRLARSWVSLLLVVCLLIVLC